MKYATIFAATFVAGAMARAVPDFDPTGDEERGLKNMGGKPASEYEDEGKKNDYEPTEPYKKDDKKKNDYEPTEPKYDDKKKDDKKKHDDDYDVTYKKYEEEKKSYEEVYFKPQPKKSCEERQKEEGDKYKPYYPPPKFDEKKSCYDKFEWPQNLHKEKPCNIKWAPKHGGEWKEEDKTVIYFYSCKDYEKPKYKVCDDCGKGAYDKWTPPKDCEASDSDNGSMYRFKFCKYGDEEQCTWGEEIAVYGEKYDEKKEAECPPPAPVPDCPPSPPTPPPAKEAAPVYPAPEAPKEEAPAAPAAPEAPKEEAAPAAPAPAYPAPEAPSSLVASNDTATEAVAPSFNGSGALRASVSFIVGVAALVTFAL